MNDEAVLRLLQAFCTAGCKESADAFFAFVAVPLDRAVQTVLSPDCLPLADTVKKKCIRAMVKHHEAFLRGCRERTLTLQLLWLAGRVAWKHFPPGRRPKTWESS